MSIKLKLYRQYHQKIISQTNFKNRYPEIFHTGKDRIYLPFENTLIPRSSSQTKSDIQRVLGLYNYKMIDYIQGTCQKNGDKRIFKIGKILQMLINQKRYRIIMSDEIFDEDQLTENQLTEFYNKYFKKDAFDCNKLRDSSDYTIDFYINEATYKKNKEIIKYYSQIYYIAVLKYDEPNDIKSYLREFNNDIIRKIKNSNKFSICISRHPYDIIGMTTGRGWTSCMNHKNNTKINDHIYADIKYGTIIAYLIYSNDKNIKHPIARIAIKPYFQKNTGIDYNPITDTKNVILIPVNRIYGEQIQEFLDQINTFIYKTQNKKIKDVSISSQDNTYTDIMKETYYSNNSLIKQNKINKHFLKDLIFFIPNRKTLNEIRYSTNNKISIYIENYQIPTYATLIEKNLHVFWTSINNIPGTHPALHHKINNKRLIEIIQKLSTNKNPNITQNELSNFKRFQDFINERTIPYKQKELPKTYTK